MTKRAITLLTGLLFVAGGMFLAPEPAAAQGRAPVDVVHAMTHDVSPPLDKMPVIPPGGGPTISIPLRKARPFNNPRGTQQDPALQSSAPSTLSVDTGQNFLGLGNGLSGFTVQYIPPDTNGAAGDTQFVQWVNASFAVFNKSDGSLVLGPAAGNTLWNGMGGTAGQACSSNNSGDPVAEYDKQAGRWVMMQPVFKAPYYLCVAVSTGSDATGSWYRYAFPIPTGYFPDYPKLAIWNDAYYITYNQFQGNTFVGAAACALDSSKMLVGNNATMQCFSVGSSYGALLPADLDGSTTPPAGSPEYLLNYDGNLQSLDLWQFRVDFGTPGSSTLSGPSNIGVASFTEACGGGTCIPQANTHQQLDSLGDRLMYRLAYRDFANHESMVVAQSVDTGSGSGNTGIRWYELRETSPSTSSQSNWGLYQQGTYAPDSNYRWMPSIAQDQNGDIAMGYSVSSSNMSPTIRYTGRVPGDTLGMMEGENDILSMDNVPSGSQTNYSRWGDYSSMALDPNDDCTFWYTTEYQPANGNAWSTRIASFAFPACSSGSTSPVLYSFSLTPSTVTAGDSSTGTVTLSATASSDVKVSLSSNNSAASVPSTVTVPQGSASATFQVTTSSSVTSTQNPTITASYGGVDKTATLTVNPATSSVTVSSLGLNPTSLTGGNSSTGTVTLSAAPTSNVSVSLSSNNSAASVPSSVTVLAGSLSASFTVTTSSVTTSTTVTITGSYNSSSASGTLAVNPPTSAGFTLTPTNSLFSVSPGSSVSDVVDVAASGGFSGSVNLSVSGVPKFANGSFSPDPVSVTTNGTASSTLTIKANKHISSGGPYILYITGTDSSGTITATATVKLTVN